MAAQSFVKVWRRLAAQVVVIRAKYAYKSASYAALAAEYGTSKHNVAMIVLRRIWAHV